MTKTRLISALVLLPLVVACVQVGGWLLGGAILLVGAIATWEFIRMMGHKTHQLTLFLAFIACLGPILLIQISLQSLFMPFITILLVISLIWQLFQAESEAPVVDWALTIIGPVYIGLGLGHLLGLRQFTDGAAWVWLALFSTWGADTLAYFTGRAFGRHKFWPRLSPKKTWEGIGGGFVGGMLLGGIVASLSSIPLLHGIIIGFLVSALSPLGDLSVSMMKRYTGVKDSSQLIPGHGGLLDRVDSLLFSLIIVFYYATWVLMV